MQIPIRIVDSDYNLVAEIDEYESLSFTRKLNGCGEFYLTMNSSLLGAEHFKLGNLLYIDKDRTAFIEHIESVVSPQGDGCENITVVGRTTEHLLNRRIILPMTAQMPQKTESLIKLLVRHNLGDMALAGRRINNLSVAASKGFGEEINWEFSYKNLADEITALCEQSELGIKITLDLASKRFNFDIIKGINRSIMQNSLPPVILSLEYDNVLEQTFVESRLDMKNTALSGGPGDGSNQEVHWINDEFTGINRRETFISNKLLETKEQIIENGQKALIETPEIQSLNGTINTNSSLKFGTDFFLGDYVTLKRNNLTLTKQVCEVTESFETGTHTVSCIFGKKSMDLIDKIKSNR